jgi:hypothetical protein
VTLREALARARHDVAKYAAMTAQNLGPPPWDARLREAVAKDVLETDGRRPAWEIWAERRGDLEGLDVSEIDRRIASIRAREDALRAAGVPGVDAALVADLVALARAFRDLETSLRR